MFSVVDVGGHHSNESSLSFLAKTATGHIIINDFYFLAKIKRGHKSNVCENNIPKDLEFCKFFGVDTLLIRLIVILLLVLKTLLW